MPGVAWDKLTAGIGDCFQGVGPKQRGGAGEDEDLAFAAGDVALVAGVLVPLELPGQAATFFAVEHATDGDEPGICFEPPHRRLDEFGDDRRVGVHDHCDVVRVDVVKELSECLIERAGLLLGIGDGGEDLCAVCACDLGGVVGAVVGDHNHLLRRPRLPRQGGQRFGHRERLVVRRHQHGQAQRRPRDVLVWKLARWKLRLLGQPHCRGSQRRQKHVPRRSQRRRKGRRNPPVPRQHPHRRSRIQRCHADEEARRGRTRRQHERQ